MAECRAWSMSSVGEGRGAWSMDQLVNDVQRRGGGGSQLLELGTTVDMGSQNSTHSSL
jgi:hypothetical protein